MPESHVVESELDIMLIRTVHDGYGRATTTLSLVCSILVNLSLGASCVYRGKLESQT